MIKIFIYWTDIPIFIDFCSFAGSDQGEMSSKAQYHWYTEKSSRIPSEFLHSA